jgi:hypothetical protein
VRLTATGTAIASVTIETFPYELNAEGCIPYVGGEVGLVGKRYGIAADDVRFPTNCACGSAVDGERSVSHDTTYRDVVSGREFVNTQALPPGAMWRASWYERFGAG